MPTISVVIPNYNHARYLRKRSESVLGQTYQDFEVILLDDFSMDESRSIIDEYGNDPRVRIELSDKNSGSTFRCSAGKRRIRMDRRIRRLRRRATARAARGSSRRRDRVTFAYAGPGRLPKMTRRKDSHTITWTQRWQADFCAVGRDECRDYFFRTNPVPKRQRGCFSQGHLQVCRRSR
jgi:cellulose synthase/poly-beta-1,6-N-acetylglucosamine synthase-like glycosyltransferase